MACEVEGDKEPCVKELALVRRKSVAGISSPRSEAVEALRAYKDWLLSCFELPGMTERKKRNALSREIASLFSLPVDRRRKSWSGDPARN